MPTPEQKELIHNMIRQISQVSSPRTQRAIARGTTKSPYTRKTLPIGLAVTKVGAPIAPMTRRTVNRTRASAKTPRIPNSPNFVDRYAPQAYKNTTWKYYTAPTRDKVIFYNSKNGQPFTFTKDGRRVNVPASYFQRIGMIPNALRERAHPRRKTHTFTAYQKRLEKHIQTVRGGPMRTQFWMEVNGKVSDYLNGHTNALKNVPTSTLIWWAGQSLWMHPYEKYGGVWRRQGGGEVSRNNILNNIQLMWNIHQNM